ncbi:carcinoembryonic antigen-related cell adhesion molecule 5-like [Arapaima gigas]
MFIAQENVTFVPNSSIYESMFCTRKEVLYIFYSFVLFLMSDSAGCGGSELSVDVRPPAGTVGSSVLFTVSLNPPAESLYYVQWTVNNINIINYLNGQNITNPLYTERIAFHSSNGSMELKNLTVTDTGIYGVNIQVTGANATDLVEFNDTVSLECSASGSSLAFLWSNDTSVITPDRQVQLSDGNKTLTILHVLRSDQGPFYCTVSNIISCEKSSAVTFSISFGPENTAVTASPEKPHYASGSNLSLSCSAQSRPAAQFRWYFNGTALNKTGPVLKLDNVQESESGNYTCLAHNTKTLRYQSSEPSPISVIGKRGRCEEYIKRDGGRPCCGRRLKRSQWATRFICGLGSVCHSSHSEVFSHCITYFAKGNS